MQTLIALLLILVAVEGSAQTQLSSPFETPRGMSVVLTNTGRTPITGYMVEVNISENGVRKARHIRYMDAQVNAFSDRPLSAGVTAEVQLCPKDVYAKSNVNYRVAGIVREDGSFEGDDSAVLILRGRRIEMMSSFEWMRSLLHGQKGQSLASLNAELEKAVVQLKVSGRGLQATEIPIKAVRTMVLDWVRGNISNPPAICLQECVDSKIDYLLGGIDRWSVAASPASGSVPLRQP